MIQSGVREAKRSEGGMSQRSNVHYGCLQSLQVESTAMAPCGPFMYRERGISPEIFFGVLKGHQQRSSSARNKDNRTPPVTAVGTT